MKNNIITHLFVFIFLLFPSLALAADTIRYIDTSCANHGDGTDPACGTAGGAGAYKSAGQAAASIDTEFADITAAGSNTSIILRAAGTTADTYSTVIFTGIVTDDTHYVELTCDPGKAAGCRAAGGAYSTSYYRIENTQYYGAIRDEIKNLRVTNIQIKSTCNDDCSGTLIAWRGNNPGTLRVDRVIGTYAPTGTPTTASANFAIGNNSNSATTFKSMYVSNSIFYGFQRGGLDCRTNGTTSTTCAFHNNTIIDSSHAGDAVGINIDAYGTNEVISLYNNIVQDVVFKSYYVEPASPATYNHAANISDDNYSPDTTGCEGGGTCRNRDLMADGSFVDAAGKDFHLVSGDTHAKDLGQDLSGNGTLAFSNDFDSQTRTSTWDIGADEYQVATTTTSTSTTTSTTATTSTTTSTSTTTTIQNTGGIERVAGLVWSDGIEPGTPSECEAPSGNTCYWVDCDAVADGTGTYASPFWGFETVFGYVDAGASYIVGATPANGGDIVYVKGTCEVTGSVDTATGPFKQVRIYQPAQLGTVARPLIIKSYRGTAQAVFDGEYTENLSAPTHADNNPSKGLIFAQDTTDAGKAITVQNIKVTHAFANGVSVGSGIGAMRIRSVDFVDNRLDQIIGTGGALSRFVDASGHVNADYVENNYFHGNDENCGHGGDVDCTLANNDGTIAVNSNGPAEPGSKITIRDNVFDGDLRALRGKHNYSGMTIDAYHNVFKNLTQVIYARTETNLIHNNLISNISGEVAFMSSENANTSVNIDIYSNSMSAIGRMLDTQNFWTDTGYLKIRDNAVDSTVSTAVPFIAIATYAGEYQALANIVINNNYFNINATQQATFSCIGPTSAGAGCTNRNFATTKTYVSDTTSSVTAPVFNNTAELRNTAGLTAAADGGKIGAYEDLICGLDTTRDGYSDTDCPPPDADRDNYVRSGSSGGSGADCDDNDRLIYPGIATPKGCSDGYYHVCQADGTYTSCVKSSTTPYCPTGCGACYYIDAINGVDTNTGTYANPWKTFLRFVSYYAGIDKPVAPQAWVDPLMGGSGSDGKCFLFMDGNYSETYTYNTFQRGLFLRGVNANASAPVRLMNYPGHSPKIDQVASSIAQKPPIMISQSSYVVVEGFEVTGNYCLGDYAACIGVGESTGIEVRNNNVHDNDGQWDATFGGIMIHGTVDGNVHHNTSYENKDSAFDDKLNNSNIVVFRGENTQITDNYAFYTTPNTKQNFFQKHANYDSSMSVKRNVFVGGWNGIAGPNVTFERNFIDGGTLQIADLGGDSFQHHINITRNTFKSMNISYWPQKGYDTDGTDAANDCDGNAPIGTLTVSDNVFVDDLASYGVDTRIFQLYAYLPDLLYTDVVGGGKLSLGNNCYYNPLTAMTFGLAEAAIPGNTGYCQEYGPVNGASYTFAQWKVAGYDTTSYEENPTLDAYNIATATNCANKGWRTSSDFSTSGGGVRRLSYTLSGGLQTLSGGM